MWALLYGVIDVADWYPVFDFIVEDGLEWGYDLEIMSMYRKERVEVGGVPTQTPPMSKRIALGGTIIAKDNWIEGKV